MCGDGSFRWLNFDNSTRQEITDAGVKQSLGICPHKYSKLYHLATDRFPVPVRSALQKCFHLLKNCSHGPTLFKKIKCLSIAGSVTAGIYDHELLVFIRATYAGAVRDKGAVFPLWNFVLALDLKYLKRRPALISASLHGSLPPLFFECLCKCALCECLCVFWG